jgi:hypothetical protein
MTYYGSNNAVSILVSKLTTLFNSFLILPNIVTFSVFSQIIGPNHNNTPHTEIKIMTNTQDGHKFRPTCPLHLSKPTWQLSASNHTLMPQDRRADILNYFVLNTADATLTVWIMTTNAPIFRALPFFYSYCASEVVPVLFWLWNLWDRFEGLPTDTTVC